MSNNISQLGMEAVIKYEKKSGRKPKDVSKTKVGYDIISSGRRIEVKGVSSDKPPFIQFNQYNFKALQKENNFWLYIVYNLKDKPKIIKLTKNEILKRAKFFYGWEIPIRKADL
ncbi:MAG: DUF3883 domain-containing protein [Nanoarchaeota archaeon]|nr:DUF3883 domain-containing protein [Nanoarchaeota archaeon]